MSNIIKKVFIFVLFFILLLQTKNSYSQEITSYGSQTNPISITMSPSNPRVGDIIKLSINSYSVNLDSAKIVWYVDEEIAKEGIGEKQFTISTENAPESMVVKVIAVTTDELRSEASKTISLAGVDLILEPTSYTHPLYKGRSSFSNQGVAKIVAIPDIIIGGVKASTKELIFRWKKDNIALGASSGMGKDYLIVTGTVPIKDIRASVEVMDSSGKTLASRSITVSPRDPKILFYENNPLYGILFNNAITGTFYMGDREELKVVAEPFFFNIESNSGNDSKFKWYVNDKNVTTIGKTNEILLKQTNKEASGTASIQLEINNLKRIFQFTSNNFNVSFGQ